MNLCFSSSKSREAKGNLLLHENGLRLMRKMGGGCEINEGEIHDIAGQISGKE